MFMDILVFRQIKVIGAMLDCGHGLAIPIILEKFLFGGVHF